MNAMVVAFSKNRIKQLRQEIADFEQIIIEFGGTNEELGKSAVLVKDFTQKNRGPEVYRGVVGCWDYDSGLCAWPCFGVR